MIKDRQSNSRLHGSQHLHHVFPSSPIEEENVLIAIQHGYISFGYFDLIELQNIIRFGITSGHCPEIPLLESQIEYLRQKALPEAPKFEPIMTIDPYNPPKDPEFKPIMTFEL